MAFNILLAFWKRDISSPINYFTAPGMQRKVTYQIVNIYIFYYSRLAQVWQEIFILRLFWPRYILIPLNRRLSSLKTEGTTLPRISREDLKIRKLTQTVVFHIQMVLLILYLRSYVACNFYAWPEKIVEWWEHY